MSCSKNKFNTPGQALKINVLPLLLHS